jgi:Calcineurin-like phosphoesterase
MQPTRVLTVTFLVCAGLATSLQSQRSGGAANPSGNGAFTFALIGDMPYGPEGDAKFPNVLADINRDQKLSFVVHDGDFKNGSSLCSDEVFQNRLSLFNQFEAPLIFVPGDNEWTDCHRANNGAYEPTERLELLRTLFFPTDKSLGQRTLVLERQSADSRFWQYRENVRWVVHNVLFVGLHVVGSNNNLGQPPASSAAEFAARNAANLDWLRQSFAVARADQRKAVMIIIQANPLFELPPSDPRRGGFNDTLAELATQTIAFDRPVVLVHGDSHYFRIDKPMIGPRSGRRVEHFTRVETFGEFDNHWLHVGVEPDLPNVFAYDQRIVAANLVAQ